MSFATEVAQSTATHRILIEIDIGQGNTQWVNIGAGIWVVSATNTYDFVDSSLLGGFTAQNFGTIGSVRADGTPLNYVSTLALVTTTDSSFYYDAANQALYVKLAAYKDANTASIVIGVSYGFCDRDFIPQNGNLFYEGRLQSFPRISISRDPLFFGRLTYGGTTIDVINSDGEYDTWGESNDIYGNEGRVLIGFEDVDYADYVRLYTGYVERVRIGEGDMSINLVDTRRQLTKPITYSCTALNALSAIEEIIQSAYGYPYGDVFYDTAAWDTAKALVGDVTINMQKPAPVIDVIEDICTSVFGLFLTTPYGLFTFKLTDNYASPVTGITAKDILNGISIDYDPTEVVSSVRVGYAKDWTTTGTAYTYYTDDSQEASVFSAYKTYNQRTFDTLLIDATAASTFATAVLDRTTALKGRVSILCPIEYYSVDISDMIRADVDREAATMLGTKALEVVGKSFDLGVPAVEFEARVDHTAEQFLAGESGAIFTDEDGALILLEA